MRTVVITDSGFGYNVRFAYQEEGRALMKALHGRWDPTCKVWEIDAFDVDAAVGGFERLGFQVILNGVAPPGTATTQAADPVETFLRELPPRLRQPAYKALARVLHPDTGGETRAMQALNRAWERVA